MLALSVACVVAYCVGSMRAHDSYLINILFPSVHSAMG